MVEMGEGIVNFMWHKDTAQPEENILSICNKICDVIHTVSWVIKNQHKNKVSESEMMLCRMW